MDLLEALAHLKTLDNGNLTGRLAGLETALRDQDAAAAAAVCEQHGFTQLTLQAALALKAAVSRVHMSIHALGILTALPHILHEDERVEALSLGAGNTGRSFDLETNHRVAEFKFIHWRGGSESMRQNGLFKDFFHLAECDTRKERYLYLLGLAHPLQFLNGGRKLTSVLSRNQRLRDDFLGMYGDRFTVTRDYYQYRRERVKLRDLTELVPALALLPLAKSEGEYGDG
jgi:hypothetical protein